MRILSLFVYIVLAASLTGTAAAQEFTLTSTDITEGQILSSSHVFQGFGCEGENLSPQLSWSDAPAGTQSFVVTAYDPDAPTGSGWWHWNVVNLSASVTSLPGGAKSVPGDAIQLRNDYGVEGFGGACPPPGEVHRYIFTVYALGVPSLDLPDGASNALAGYMTRANALASASITAVYTR